MSDSDLISLYSARILELTTQIPQFTPAGAARAPGSARSPHCGSTVSVEVILANDRITDFAQSVKTCALGQASAAIFGAGVIGQSVEAIATLRSQVAQMLAADGPAPAAPFADYEVLRAARGYKNRHASILLCIDATLNAARA
ncbi:MAG: iron-sulfur cluster assembly scaffold protein [Cypionkella sp.]|nr:iron-sulfur cluster assembly scaffold protein [Cypionkella sp.]